MELVTMRVLLREMPLMLRDMLAHTLERKPGVELLREPLPEPSDLPSPSTPDVVILGTEDPVDPDGAPALLSRWPRSQVLLISTNGQQASLFELQPHRIALGEMSIDELLQVVSRVAEDRSRVWEV